ncbi:MAG: transporter substrate-binding domain-containing protein [Clostridia bacterium]|nr:transporter substrate-binding domain-containing protein [Clostridia bacterium]
MKKILSVLLVAVIVLTLCATIVACGNKDNKPVVVSDLVLAQEQYGIAAKKGNDALISKINEALIAIADGEMKTVANAYGLTSELAVTASTVNPLANASDASWTNLVARNKVVIGYTVFAPIAFDVVDDVPTKGYDIDLAKAVFNYLNTTYSTNIVVEFLEIQWSAKEAMLEGGSIDLVWNGLTITEDRLAEMCISVPYLNNKQVAVVMGNNANKLTSVEAMKDAIAGAEDGSAGEAQIEANSIGKEYIKCTSQLDAYNKLKAGTLDVIVIDSIMANYYISLEK